MADVEAMHSWAAEHRRLFADAADELGEEGAGRPTLCEGWDVRTLAGHMLQPHRVPSWRFLLTAARTRSMARACDVIATGLADRPLAEITGELRERADDRLSPWYIGPAGPYTDSCIHLRDLARPNGLEVTVPVERWVAALDVIVSERGRATFLPSRGLLEGVRWVTEDAAWSHGRGPEVRGSAEALTMLASGRRAYLGDVDGPGVELVATRLRR